MQPWWPKSSCSKPYTRLARVVRWLEVIGRLSRAVHIVYGVSVSWILHACGWYQTDGQHKQFYLSGVLEVRPAPPPSTTGEPSDDSDSDGDDSDSGYDTDLGSW
eukprot:COSAG01_NODE_292_length_19376_cov_61.487239_11_plen_104_part_00